jgi:hypothetical protein
MPEIEKAGSFLLLSFLKGLLQSNNLNLNRHTLGQLLNSHATPSRLVAKVLGVLFIHIRKVTHIGQKDSNLDDLCDFGSGGGEDCAHVLDAESGLFLEGSGFEDFAFGVAGDAAGSED